MTVSIGREEHPRRASARMILERPFTRDVLVGVGFFLVWWIAITVARSVGWYPRDVTDYYITGALIALALLLCRLLPAVGLVVVAVGSSWSAWEFDQPEIRILPLVVAGFLSAASGLRLAAAIPITLLSTTLTLIPISALRDSDAPEGWAPGILSYVASRDPSAKLLAGVVVLAAVLLGRSIRRQRTAVLDLAEKNRELVRLRDADIARAAAEERTAVARDVHDVVAHHVAAMVIRAQAAERVAESRPDELRSAVGWVVTNGREALASMRQVTRVLRADTGAREAESLGDAVRALADRVRDTGVVVHSDVRVDGSLAGAQEEAVLRITQEALTNVMLHSSAANVRLTIVGSAGRVGVTVTDDGEPLDTVPTAEALRGNGIAGMRERVRLLDGSIDVGPLAAGSPGWTVAVVLPPREGARS